MNKGKKATIIIVVITILLIGVMYIFNYGFASTENVYLIQTDASSLALNDTFTVSIAVECNTTLNGIEGRIEFGDDVELVDGENSCNWTTFAEKYHSGLIKSVDSQINVYDGFITFSIMGNSDWAQGTTEQYLTLNLRVKSSTQSNVEIKWRERNKSGFYDITSITIPRTDVSEETNGQSSSSESSGTASVGENSSDASSSGSVTLSTGNSSGSVTSGTSSDGSTTSEGGGSGTSSSGTSGTGTSGSSTSTNGQSTATQDSSTIAGASSSGSGGTTIVQAGESDWVIVLIILALILALIGKLKCRENKFY